MKSILQTEKECYICHAQVGLEDHHIYFGNGLRPKSERMGFKCWLCQLHHRDSKQGVHGNRKLDLKLKRECQQKFEESHSHEEFMRIIKRNYLEMEDEQEWQQKRQK